MVPSPNWGAGALWAREGLVVYPQGSNRRPQQALHTTQRKSTKLVDQRLLD